MTLSFKFENSKLKITKSNKAQPSFNKRSIMIIITLLLYTTLRIISITNSQICSILPLMTKDHILTAVRNFMIEVSIDRPTYNKRLSVHGWVRMNDLSPGIKSIMRYYNIDGVSDPQISTTELFNIKYDNNVPSESSILLQLSESGGVSDRRFKIVLLTNVWYFVAFTADYATDQVGFLISNFGDTEITRKIIVNYDSYPISQRNIVASGCEYDNIDFNKPIDCLDGTIRNFAMIFEYFNNPKHLYLMLPEVVESIVFVIDVYDKTLDTGYAKNSNKRMYTIVTPLIDHKDSDDVVNMSKPSNASSLSIFRSENFNAAILTDKSIDSTVSKIDVKGIKTVSEQNPIENSITTAVVDKENKETDSENNKTNSSDTIIDNRLVNKQIEKTDTFTGADSLYNGIKQSETNESGSVQNQLEIENKHNDTPTLPNNLVINGNSTIVNDPSNSVITNDIAVTGPETTNDRMETIPQFDYSSFGSLTQQKNDTVPSAQQTSKKNTTKNSIPLLPNVSEYNPNAQTPDFITPNTTIISSMSIPTNNASASIQENLHNNKTTSNYLFNTIRDPITLTKPDAALKDNSGLLNTQRIIKNEDIRSTINQKANDPQLMSIVNHASSKASTIPNISNPSLITTDAIRASSQISVRNPDNISEPSSSDSNNSKPDTNLIFRNNDSFNNEKSSIPTSPMSYSSFAAMRPSGIMSDSNYSYMGRNEYQFKSRRLLKDKASILLDDDEYSEPQNVSSYVPFSKTTFNNRKNILIKNGLSLNTSNFLSMPTFYLRLRYKEPLGDSYRLLQFQSFNGDMFLYVNLVKNDNKRYIEAEIPSLNLYINFLPAFFDNVPADIVFSIVQYQNKISLLLYNEKSLIQSDLYTLDIEATYDMIVFDPLFTDQGILELYTLHVLNSPSSFVYNIYRNPNSLSQADATCVIPSISTTNTPLCLKCKSSYTLYANTQDCHIYCPLGYRNIQGVCFQCTDEKCSELDSSYFKPTWIGGSNIMLHQIKKIDNFTGNYTGLFDVKIPAKEYFNYTLHSFPSNNTAIYSFSFMGNANYYYDTVIFKINSDVVLYDSNMNRLQNQEYIIKFGLVNGVLVYRSGIVENRLKILSVICYIIFVLTMALGFIGSCWKCSYRGYHKFMYQKTLQSFLIYQYFAFWSFYNLKIPYNAKTFLNGMFIYSTGWHEILTAITRSNHADNKEYLDIIDKRVLRKFYELGVSNTFILNFAFILLLQGIFYFMYILFRIMYKNPQELNDIGTYPKISIFSKFVSYIVSEFQLKVITTLFTLFTVEMTVFGVYNMFQPNFKYNIFIISFIWAIIWLIILAFLILTILFYPKKPNALFLDELTKQRHGYIYDGLCLSGLKKHYQGIQYLHYFLFSIVLVVAYNSKITQILVNLFLLLMLIVFLFMVLPAENDADNYEQLGVHILLLLAKIFMTVLVIDDAVKVMDEFDRWIVGFFVVVIVFIAIVWNFMIIGFKLFVHGYKCFNHPKTNGIKLNTTPDNMLIKKENGNSVTSDGRLEVEDQEKNRIQNIERLKELLSATNTLNDSSKRRDDIQNLGVSSEIPSLKGFWTSRYLRNKTISVMQPASKEETDRSDNNRTIIYIDRDKTESHFKDSKNDVSENNRDITFQARSPRYDGPEPNQQDAYLAPAKQNTTVVRSENVYNKRADDSDANNKTLTSHSSRNSSNDIHRAIKGYLQREDLIKSRLKINTPMDKDNLKTLIRIQTESVQSSPLKPNKTKGFIHVKSPIGKLQDTLVDKNRSKKIVDNGVIKEMNVNLNRSFDLKSRLGKRKSSDNIKGLDEFKGRFQTGGQQLSGIGETKSNNDNNDTIVDITDEMAVFLEENFAYVSEVKQTNQF